MKKQKNKINPNLDFENEENTFKSIEVIQKEFFKKTVKTLIYLIIILAIYLTYFLITINPELLENTFLVSIDQYYYHNLTIAWSLFSTTTFLFVYFLKIIYLKYTPSLISFVKNESKNLGFNFQKKFDSGFIFLMLNILSIIMLMFIDIKLIQFENSSLGRFFIVTFSTYLILSLIVPIMWVLFNDKFVIQLKEDFYIFFDFQFKISKPKKDDSNLVGIHLKSNRLSTKNDRCGRVVHSKIAKRRWLSKRKQSKFNPYLHFYEFSTPLNFQKQFLNIALALTEWENYYGSNVLCFEARIPFNKIKSEERFLDYQKSFSIFT
ncbi:MAG: hypothetical protein KGD73_12190 [Candidatus Lokiarchaeota archaeon]|nr:hypothetical protein [Candidatus Lokiarchaeota archaeon]